MLITQEQSLKADDTLYLCRPDDNLLLKFDFYNLVVEKQASSNTHFKLINKSKSAVVSVRLPSQHVTEYAVSEEDFKQTPEFYVRSFTSGPSFLSFKVTDNNNKLLINEISDLLEWDKFEFINSNHARNIDPIEFNDSKQIIPPTYPVTSSSNIPTYDDRNYPISFFEPIYKIFMLPKLNEPKSFLNWTSNLKEHFKVKTLQQNEDTSAIQTWRNELKEINSSGSIIDPNFRIIGYANENKSSESLGGNLLPDLKQRKSLAKLSTEFKTGLDSNNKPKFWKPVDVHSKRFRVSSHGADVDYNFNITSSSNISPPKGHSLREWIHRTSVGVNNNFQISTVGVLMPYGVKAQWIEIGERVVVDGKCYVNFTRRLKALEKERDYKLSAKDNDNRSIKNIPFQKIRVLFDKSPEVYKNIVDEELKEHVWWVDIEDKKPYKPLFEGTDHLGTNIPFHSSVMFIEKTFFENPGFSQRYNKLKKKIESELKEDNSRLKISFEGKKVGYVEKEYMDKVPGNLSVDKKNQITFLATEAMLLDFQLYSLDDFDNDVNSFPIMFSSRIRLPVVSEVFNTEAVVDASYSDEYLDDLKENRFNTFLNFTNTQVNQSVKKLDSHPTNCISTPSPILKTVSICDQSLTLRNDMYSSAINNNDLFVRTKDIFGNNANILRIPINKIIGEYIYLDETPKFRIEEFFNNKQKDIFHQISKFDEKIKYFADQIEKKTPLKLIEDFNKWKSLVKRISDIHNIKSVVLAIECLKYSINKILVNELNVASGKSTEIYSLISEIEVLFIKKYAVQHKELKNINIKVTEKFLLLEKLISDIPRLEEFEKSKGVELFNLLKTKINNFVYNQALEAIKKGKTTYDSHLRIIRGIIPENVTKYDDIYNHLIISVELYLKNKIVILVENNLELSAISSEVDISKEAQKNLDGIKGRQYALLKDLKELGLSEDGVIKITAALSELRFSRAIYTCLSIDYEKRLKHRLNTRNLPLDIDHDFLEKLTTLTQIEEKSSLLKSELDSFKSDIEKACKNPEVHTQIVKKFYVEFIKFSKISSSFYNVFSVMQDNIFQFISGFEELESKLLNYCNYEKTLEDLSVEYVKIRERVDSKINDLEYAYDSFLHDIENLLIKKNKIIKDHEKEFESKFDLDVTTMTASLDDFRNEIEVVKKLNILKNIDEFRNKLVQDFKKVIRIDYSYQWNTSQLKTCNIGPVDFITDIPKKSKIENVSHVSFSPLTNDSSSKSYSYISNFAIEFLGIIRVVFDRISVDTVTSGDKTEFTLDLKIREVEFKGVLKLINLISESIGNLYEGFDVELDKNQLVGKYRQPLNNMTFPCFILTGLFLRYQVNLPLDNREPKFVFGFNEPSNRFSAISGYYIGRGYSFISLGTSNGVDDFIFSLAYGGKLNLDVGVARGRAELSLSFTIKYKDEIIEAYVKLLCSGRLTILGFISASIVFRCLLRAKGNLFVGSASVKYSYSIGLYKKSVTMTMRKSIEMSSGKSNKTSFRINEKVEDAINSDKWQRYVNSF
jgi:hypothetical protein